MAATESVVAGHHETLRKTERRTGRLLERHPRHRPCGHNCKPHSNGARGNNASPSPVFQVDARYEASSRWRARFMARLFAVPRLFLISKRAADCPRLARTPSEPLPQEVPAPFLQFLQENRLARAFRLKYFDVVATDRSLQHATVGADLGLIRGCRITPVAVAAFTARAQTDQDSDIHGRRHGARC